MHIIQRMLLIVLAAVLVGGCVSRTTTRSKRLSELPRQTHLSLDAQGNVTDTRLIWIWEDDFWRHP